MGIGRWGSLYGKLYNRVINKMATSWSGDGMASKDQAIGALIFIVCLVVAIGYIFVLCVPQGTLWFVNLLKGLGWQGMTNYIARLWLVAIPVLVAFVVVLAIGAWIGWTMATTPPPKPLEEIEAEEKLEEEKVEEKPEPTEKEETEKKKKK